MLYHAPTVEKQYFGHNKEYGAKELVYAYTQIVAKANDLSAKVARDEDGQIADYTQIPRILQVKVIRFYTRKKSKIICLILHNNSF